jgi:hypothetical protein
MVSLFSLSHFREGGGRDEHEIEGEVGRYVKK